MIGEKEMSDIAFVIQKNIPLRTLNLSHNVVNEKAAVILAQSLGSNSHLKELDLRNNNLRDGGIAVLIEPFIIQQLQKDEVKRQKKNIKQKKEKEQLQEQTLVDQNEQNADPKPNQQEEVEVVDSEAEQPEQKQEDPIIIKNKLMMRVQKLYLDNNGQTEEALKHIYTALLANKKIEIFIDLPEHFKLEDGDSFEKNKEEEWQDNQGVDQNTIVPIGDPKDQRVNAPQKGEFLDGQVSPTSKALENASLEELNKDSDEDLKDGANADEDQEQEEEQHRKSIPRIFRASCFRPCRHICYRDA